MDLNTLAESTKDTEDIYGIKDGEPTVQALGDVTIRKDRVICFPNVVTPLICRQIPRLTIDRPFR